MTKRWFASKRQEDYREQIGTKKGLFAYDNNEQFPYILFADDDVNMREYVHCLLKDKYRITTVGDGLAALELARETLPDLVLTDIIMPKMDGMQLLQELRRDPSTQYIPLILLSVKANDASKVDSFDAGADDYLVKPFTAPELLARINTHIKLKKARNDAYQTIKESKELLQNVFNGVPSSIVVYRTHYDTQGLIEDFELLLLNKLMCQFFNLPEQELIGKRYCDLLLPPSQSDILNLFKEVVYTGQSTDFEEWHEVNGINRCFRFRANKLHDLLIVIADDITISIEARVKNEELRAERQKMEERQQREIFRTSLRAQEEERRRISENLHNGLCQMLFSIKLNLDTINLNNKDTPIEEHIEKLKNAESLLTNCIRESKRISHELMPAILADFGIKPAIENMCSQLTGRCNFVTEIDHISHLIDQEILLTIYRIIQELALNVVKHSQATKALIRLYDTDDSINAIVSDNGIGFDIHRENNNTLGLLLIKNRVKMLKGNLSCVSATDQGSEVRISLPKTMDIR